MKRSLRTRFDFLRSPTKGFVEIKQAEQKQHHDAKDAHMHASSCLASIIAIYVYVDLTQVKLGFGVIRLTFSVLLTIVQKPYVS